jgi:hypothetical protein
MRNVLDKSCGENQKHILCLITFFPENRAVYKIKVKELGPEGSRRLRLLGLSDSRRTTVIKLSVLSTGRLYPPGKNPGTHFL